MPQSIILNIEYREERLLYIFKVASHSNIVGCINGQPICFDKVSKKELSQYLDSFLSKANDILQSDSEIQVSLVYQRSRNFVDCCSEKNDSFIGEGVKNLKKDKALELVKNFCNEVKAKFHLSVNNDIERKVMGFN